MDNNRVDGHWLVDKLPPGNNVNIVLIILIALTIR